MRKNISVICIDEAQFFSEEIIDLVNHILMLGKSAIVAGLSQDSFGKPFGSMPHLLAVADRIISLSAVCSKCRGIGAATRTYRKCESKEQVVVGGADTYEPRCFGCWSKTWMTD